MTINEMGLGWSEYGEGNMAALIACNAFGLRKERVRESLIRPFSLEHKMELVGSLRGVKFINDSKATNVNSAWYSLEQTVGPIVWIAGGADRWNDYGPLLPLIKKKVRSMVCLGVDNRRLHGFPVDTKVNVTNMADAVRMAYKLAVPGDTVLLSPACASFDLFENYEDRGRQFKDEMRKL